MAPQIYEKYWSCTLAFTDFYGSKFNRYLDVITTFIDERRHIPYSEHKYRDLQIELQNIFHIQDVSIRKAINEFIKLGFIARDLGSYHEDARTYLISTNAKKKTLFSKIVYLNACLDNSVTSHSGRKEINFLLKTLNELNELSKLEVLALMTVDITTFPRGHLTREELDEAKRYTDRINFQKRKYNQISHFWQVLANLDGLNIHGEFLCFEEDAAELGISTAPSPLLRDPYLHRIYRNQLKVESAEKYGNPSCMLSGIAYPALVASLIKPFHLCAHVNEAYDPNNGLLLSQNNDSYFDLGYISFKNNGTIIISNRLEKTAQEEVRNLYLDATFLTPKRIEYLEYHRERVFI